MPVAMSPLSTVRRGTTITALGPLEDRAPSYSSSFTMDNLLSELEWRGLVYGATEGLADVLAKERVTAYIGFDPTSSSLHVGSLLTVMGLARLQRFGHSPVAIVGGGTGMMGDPIGKSQERVLLSPEQVGVTGSGFRGQLGG